MKPEEGHPKARQFLGNLAAGSRYSFTTAEARSALGLSAPALKVALNRLQRQELIVAPAKGFWIIVLPEYRSLGCLPADQFIPSLMKALKLPYYAGLLTAAQYHGAAHQRPQEFQVLLEKPRRRLVCGRVRVHFIVRKNLKAVPVQSLNTPRGTVLVSTPEATALDLVGYHHHAGGLSQVATVLSELAERIDPKALAKAAAIMPVPWAQRLGYLLERAGAGDKARPLQEFVRARAHESVLLLPKAVRGKSVRNDDWKLFINTDVEPEL
ncbi:MAG: type IV toxin-antitoxin system AbiEi family antitoxin [Vicinamibacterales bacterium]